MYGGNTPPGEKFFTVNFFRKKTSKYAKLIVESCICDNLNQIYQYFPFLTKNFEIHLVKTLSGSH